MDWSICSMCAWFDSLEDMAAPHQRAARVCGCVSWKLKAYHCQPYHPNYLDCFDIAVCEMAIHQHTYVALGTTNIFLSRDMRYVIIHIVVLASSNTKSLFGQSKCSVYRYMHNIRTYIYIDTYIFCIFNKLTKLHKCTTDRLPSSSDPLPTMQQPSRRRRSYAVFM